MSIDIKLILSPDAEPITREVDEGTSIEEVVQNYRSKLPYRIMCATVDNRDESLNYAIRRPCEIRLCDIRTNTANRVFQRSISLLYLAAAKSVLGSDEVEILNSINRGLYTVVKEKITDEQVESIEKKMWDLIDANFPIKTTSVKKNDLLEFIKSSGADRQYELFRNAPDMHFISLCDLDGYVNYFYGVMVPSTGYIERFAIQRYHDGILLRYPTPDAPNDLPQYYSDDKVYETFEEEREYEEANHLSFISEINEQIEQGRSGEIIAEAERKHTDRITEIAKAIKDSGKRMVLIAGPSSSGKTTFSNRLIARLEDFGVRSLYTGTDDYFVDREFTPRDAKGEYDYEGLDAMDVPLFARNINDLLSGKEVDMPEYDFIEGRKKFGKRTEKLGESQIIVIEGIHALNGAMSEGISEDVKFKIYISPLTQLSIDDHNRIPVSDVRLMRRILRDNRTRGNSVFETIHSWPKVRTGEIVNILPYNAEADMVFNSTLIYELPVIKKYVQPLLEDISKDHAEFGYAEWLLYLLTFFRAIEDEDSIPRDSILREFIGGGLVG
ncbi:MAG: nucleoside kinase [Clostridiales Family XIII bacterium]|jgi:uridine kinase|nr:nucleoside kinase [Clostridiales Family XIII bacterium]